MKPVGLLARTLVITLGLAAMGAYSQPFLPHSPKPAQTTAVVAASHEAQADVVFAVVVGIDYDSRMIVLDSALGQLVTVATPTQLRDLHPGDLVIVSLNRKDHQNETPRDNEREDTVLI